MISDLLRLTLHLLRILPFYAATLLGQRISALVHRYTYKALADHEVQNVVVVGGSFGGHATAKRLTETLPTGYRVVLVEKNSHFNWVFAFPRFSVARGYETYAFLPYGGLSKGAPEGIFRHVQGTATAITKHDVELESGARIPYRYLVIATGTSSALPSKVQATEKAGGQEELRGMQRAIEEAGKIAVVGGGAVGVELVSDIKDFYPEKKTVLFQSRDRLLPGFGKRLHDHVMGGLGELGVEVRLNERPKSVDGHVLQYGNGEEEDFDMIASGNLVVVGWSIDLCTDTLRRATPKFGHSLYALSVLDLEQHLARRGHAFFTDSGSGVSSCFRLGRRCCHRGTSNGTRSVVSG